jgi:hypothetical protein
MSNDHTADSLRVVSDSVQKESKKQQEAHDKVVKSLSDTLQKIRKDLKYKETQVVAADAYADSMATALNSTQAQVSQVVADAMEAKNQQIKARDNVIVSQHNEIVALGKLVHEDSLIIRDKDLQINKLVQINTSLSRSLIAANNRARYALIIGTVGGYLLNGVRKH